MIKGKTITELAQELERQQETKRDFVVPDERLALHARDGGVVAEIGGDTGMTFGVNRVAHTQFASKLNIPQRYYDRMLEEAPDMLTGNVNGWLRKSGGTKRLLRTLDGQMRAVLSDRYRPLDNFDLAQAVMPTLMKQPDVEVKSSEITDRRMYLQAVSPRVTGEVQKGDVVQAGLVISNSEVGCGSLRVEPLIYRLACLNGLITSAALRTFHLGARHGESDNVQEVLSDRTRSLSDKAYWHRVQDVVRAAFDMAFFRKAIDKLRDAAGDKITKTVEKVVELTGKRFGFNDTEHDGFLKNLIEGADLSRWGVANAITAMANDHDSYDRAVELERDGGKIIELSKNEWAELAVA